MPSPSSRLARRAGLLVACLTSFLSACASPWKKTSIELPEAQRAERVFVYREALVVDGVRQPLGFEHPTAIPAADLRRLFRHLAYRPSRLWEKAIDELVFQPDTAAQLATAVAHGLREIGPDERLRFLATDDRFSNLFLGTTGSSGVVFRTEDGVLHLAFDRIHQGVNDGHGGRPEDVIFADDPTEETGGSPLVPFPGSRRHIAGATDYPRWLEIDPTSLAALPETPVLPATTDLASEGGAGAGTATAPEASARETVGANEAGTADVRTSDAPQGAGSTEGSVLPVTAATASEVDSTEPAADGDASYEATRREIELLRRLRDDGAISQEDFERELSRVLERTASSKSDPE